MADDRVILLTNRGDGVDEVLNDENIEEDEVGQSGLQINNKERNSLLQ